MCFDRCSGACKWLCCIVNGWYKQTTLVWFSKIDFFKIWLNVSQRLYYKDILCCKQKTLSSTLIPSVCIVSYKAGSISSRTLQAFRKCLVWHDDVKWRSCNFNISIASSNNSLFLMLLSKCLITVLRHSYSVETSATFIVLCGASRLITPDKTCCTSVIYK